MNKATLIGLLLIFVNNSYANGTDHWECALNLQQGDTGSMTLKRSDSLITGSININRNGNKFTQELEGLWFDNKIELKRFVNASSNQPMHGIAISVGAKHVKMGGRYAEGFNGVWSADCDLVSTTKNKADSPSTQEASQVLPSISVRATPSSPVSHDTIKFAARAFHPDDIASISFFLNNKPIHQCKSNQCSVEYGRLKAGTYQWHVIAKSKTGLENKKHSNKLIVSDTNRCSISGIATGPAVAQSNKVTLKLSSLGSDKAINKSIRFDAGTYRFDELSKGRYLLSINAPNNLGILVSPVTKQITCDTQKNLRQNFDFQ